MELMSDELLVDTYHTAVKFELDPDFIEMLQLEMKRRKSNAGDTKSIA